MGFLDHFRLDGQVAIITGGGGGIGSGIARAFADAGADVAVVSRKPGPLAAVKADVEKSGRRCIAISADVTAKSAPSDIVKETVAKLGRVTILINNAGGLGDEINIQTAMNIDEENWDKQIRLNLTSVLRMTQAAAPAMTDGGSIINMSSIMAYKPAGGSPGYIASKAAMNNLTVLQAQELAPKIRVNGIAPGPIITEALTKPLQLETEEDYARIAKEWGVLAARLGTPDDIATVALLLASRAGSFITGQTIIVSGGM